MDMCGYKLCICLTFFVNSIDHGRIDRASEKSARDATVELISKFLNE
jgi:hypothetical protein